MDAKSASCFRSCKSASPSSVRRRMLDLQSGQLASPTASLDGGNVASASISWQPGSTQGGRHIFQNTAQLRPQPSASGQAHTFSHRPAHSPCGHSSSHHDILPTRHNHDRPVTMADFEALKDQWSDIEDRDGIRLSWNTFPSSRMVSNTASIHRIYTDSLSGSFAPRW